MADEDQYIGIVEDNEEKESPRRVLGLPFQLDPSREGGCDYKGRGLHDLRVQG